MRSFGVLDGDVREIVDLYFGQCSIMVTCRDLAVMGATLANEGINPLTGARAIGARHVSNVLSVMATCGMYDNSGEWVFNVGLPAKSGVAGGVLAVLPGQLGIGVFSPRLDARGNSVRGIGVCERLSRELELHIFASKSAVRSVVRRIRRGNEIASNRVRAEPEEALLAQLRVSLACFELQGDLVFASVEKAHRAIASAVDGVDIVVVDLTYVTGIDAPARAALNALAESLTASGRTPVAVAPHPAAGIDAELVPDVLTFIDCDTALEWCEDRMLRAHDCAPAPDAAATLEAFDLLDGLSDAEMHAVERAVELRLLEPGTAVFREGSPADSLYFLLAGRVNVLLPLSTGGGDRSRRLATFGHGVAFGEMALLDEGRRSADVVCDDQCLVAALSLDALERLDLEYPRLRPVLHGNLARLLARARLRAANAQIRRAGALIPHPSAQPRARRSRT